MIRTVAALVALSFFLHRAPGQTLTPGVEDMQHNLQTATANVTMEAAGTPPFRLQATFETFDYEGKPDGNGTLVEEWLNAGNRRRVITFRDAVLTQVSHGGVTRRSGDSFRGSYMERAVLDALLSPGPTGKQIAEGAPAYKTFKAGTLQLDCVLLNPLEVSDGAQPAEKQPNSYCMSQTPLLLRLVQQRYKIQTTYNHFAQLGAHYLPKEIVVSDGGETRASLHVTSFATAPTLKESDFALPPGPDTSAVDIDPPHRDSRLLQGSLIEKVAPHYPETDRQNRVGGSVYLHALIDETGKITELEVLSAPSKTLAKAALSAVSQWRYKPYQINGKPTSVDTTITVNFTIRG